MRRLISFLDRLAIWVLAVAAILLFVPQRLGIQQVVIDTPDSQSNLPFASATYALKTDPYDAFVGDKILVRDGDYYSRFVLVDLDVSNGTGTVKNPYDANETYQISVSEYVPKILVTIPYIGYLAIIVKSTQGIYTLAGVVFALLILYLLTRKRK